MVENSKVVVIVVMSLERRLGRVKCEVAREYGFAGGSDTKLDSTFVQARFPITRSKSYT